MKITENNSLETCWFLQLQKAPFSFVNLKPKMLVYPLLAFFFLVNFLSSLSPIEMLKGWGKRIVIITQLYVMKILPPKYILARVFSGPAQKEF